MPNSVYNTLTIYNTQHMQHLTYATSSIYNTKHMGLAYATHMKNSPYETASICNTQCMEHSVYTLSICSSQYTPHSSDIKLSIQNTQHSWRWAYHIFSICDTQYTWNSATTTFTMHKTYDMQHSTLRHSAYESLSIFSTSIRVLSCWVSYSYYYAESHCSECD